MPTFIKLHLVPVELKRFMGAVKLYGRAGCKHCHGRGHIGIRKEMHRGIVFGGGHKTVFSKPILECCRCAMIDLEELQRESLKAKLKETGVVA